LDAEDLTAGRVIELADPGGGVRLGDFCRDRPAKRHILVDHGLRKLDPLCAEVYQDEALIGSFGHFDGCQVSEADIADIDSGDSIVSLDLGCHSSHEVLDPAERSGVLRSEGRPHYKAWAYRHQLEALVLWQARLEVPGSLLGESLALGVVTHAFGSVDVTPVALVENCRSNCFGNALNRGDARRDDAPTHAILGTGLDNGSGASDSGSHVLLQRGILQGDGGGNVDDVSGALDGAHHGLLIRQVRLHQLDLVEKVAEGLPDGIDLRSAVQVTNRAADSKATVTEELQSGLRADVARNTGDCH